MTFPRSPSKPITGGVKLVIKSPEVAVNLDSEPDVPAGSADGVLDFKLPSGFVMDNGLNSLLDRQIDNALRSLDEIESRYLKCGSCRRKDVDFEALLIARYVLNTVRNLCSSALIKPLTITVAHHESGEIKVEVFYLSKVLMFFFAHRALKSNLIGFYENNVFIDSRNFSEESCNDLLIWLLKQG